MENYHYIEQHLNTIKTAERKLLFVPIVFIFIRIWGLITDVTTFYLSDSEMATLRESKISAALVFMSVRNILCIILIIIIIRALVIHHKVLSMVYSSACSLHQ